MTNPDVQNQSAIAARWKPLILALMVLALLLRLLAAIAVERHVQNAGRMFLVEGDANGYWQLAQNLARGEDYAIHTPPRYVLRVPGFPLLLAASIRLFGDSVFAARIVLACVGTLCCWLTYCLGCRVHMRRTGFWAALFVAVHPLHVGNSVLILSETWFTLGMLSSLLALLWWLDPRDVACPVGQQTRQQPGQPCIRRLAFRAFITGILIGGTTLIRPGFLPWLVVSCAAALTLLKVPRRTSAVNSDFTNDGVEPESAAAATEPTDRAPMSTVSAQNASTTAPNSADLSSKDRRPAMVPAAWSFKLMACAGLIAGCMAVLLPWAIRNHGVTGHWVFTSLWSGPSLYDGLNPQATGASDMQFFDDEETLLRMSEYEMNQHYKSRAVEFAKQNPGRVVELGLKKASLFLAPVPNYIKSAGWMLTVICGGLWLLMWVTSVAGIFSRQWDAAGLLVLLGPMLLFLLVHMVFVGSVRYRLPEEFPLAVLAAMGWRWLVLSRLSGR